MAQHLQGGQGWRGDGRQVPGNQPGGANGRYGRYGQAPDQAIPQDDAQQIDRSAAQGGQQGAQSTLSRYRQPLEQPGQAVGDNAYDNFAHPGTGPQHQQEAQDNSVMNFSPEMGNRITSGQGQGSGAPQQAGQQPQQGAQGISALSGMQGTGMAGQQNAAAATQQAPAQPAPDPTPTAPAPAAQPAAAQPAAAQPAQQNTMASPFGTMNFGGAASTPKMADGGVITSPTRAILGDNGPEMVVPLNNPNADVTPGMAPPGAMSRYGHAAQGMAQQFGKSALQNIQDSPGGQMLTAAHDRYSQAKMGNAMNQNAAMMQQQGHQANLANLDPSPAQHSNVPMDGMGADTPPMQPEQIPEAPAMAPPQDPAGHAHKMPDVEGDGAEEGADAAAGGAEAAAAAFAKGGIATSPTNAILGEHGPEAVVPLPHVGAGMFTPHRYRAMTGPRMIHAPMRPMAPASLDPHMKGKSNWKKWDATH